MRCAIGITFVEGPGEELAAFVGENFEGENFEGEAFVGEEYMGEVFVGDAFMGDFPTKPLPPPWGGEKAAGKQRTSLHDGN